MQFAGELRMRRLLITLGISLIFSLSLSAEENSWRIDPNHSGAHFSVRHMMISTVRGEFTGVTGSVIYDPKDPTRDSVEATVDCSTVNTGDVEGPSAPIRDPRGNEKIGLSASTQISRKKFSIIWNEVMESGGVAVADEVTISLDLELIKNTKA
jgi:polyisoprenoid-binding protein YceI